MQNLRVYRYIDKIARTGSIRQAAEQLAITPSALNRRVIALENELGVEIFDRLSRGVRLSTAGELLVDMMRKHLADSEAAKSRIADLSGLRRGHVSIACSQAVLPHFLPDQIERYQAQFPQVTFNVSNMDGEDAAEALLNYGTDLVIVFDSLRQTDFHAAFALPQQIHAIMSESHPLAKNQEVSLGDCIEYPLALPSMNYGVRRTIEDLIGGLSSRVTPTVEADSYVLLQHFIARSQAVGFELQIGIPLIESFGLTSRPLKNRKTTSGSLFIYHLKGRTLPVAAARFLQQVVEALVKT